MPTFSVITPVYNGEKFIKETVESVLQNCEELDFEYLVINDGSTDGTRDILEGFGSRINLINQKNSGQASAINKGITLAMGKYLTIVNADDPLIGDELFQESAKIMDFDESVVVTYPDWQLIDETGCVLETVKVKEFSLDELVAKFNCLVGPGGVFRASKAKELGGWDKTFHFVPDYDFWLKMSELGSFQRIPKVLASWRSHNQSISVSSRGLEMANERVLVMENHINRNRSFDKNFIRKSRASSLVRAAVLSYFDSRVDGRRLILKSIRIYPKIFFGVDFRALVFLLTLPVSRWIVESLRRISRVDKLETTIRISLKS